MAGGQLPFEQLLTGVHGEQRTGQCQAQRPERDAVRARTRRDHSSQQVREHPRERQADHGDDRRQVAVALVLQRPIGAATVNEEVAELVHGERPRRQQPGRAQRFGPPRHGVNGKANRGPRKRP
jgi:hypothetical protein